MEDAARTSPQRDVRDASLLDEAEQIARLVARTIGGDGDLAPGEALLVAVARQRDAAGGVGRLREPRAVDAPFGAAAPAIRRAGEPAPPPFRCRHEPGLGAQLGLEPHDARGGRAEPPVGPLPLAGPPPAGAGAQ